MVTPCLTFEKVPNSLSKGLHYCTFLPAMYVGFSFSLFSLVTCPFFHHSHLSGCEVVSHCGLGFHLLANDVEHFFFFKFLLAFCISVSEKYLLEPLCIF